VPAAPPSARAGYTQTSGVGKLSGNDVVFTASGGSIANFRYAVLYNATAGSASNRPLIGWADYGSTVTVASGETFTVDFDGTNGILTVT
jgi:1-deoxy-D-xylulose 5-phosphate reductoisomerase